MNLFSLTFHTTQMLDFICTRYVICSGQWHLVTDLLGFYLQYFIFITSFGCRMINDRTYVEKPWKCCRTHSFLTWLTAESPQDESHPGCYSGPKQASSSDIDHHGYLSVINLTCFPATNFRQSSSKIAKISRFKFVFSVCTSLRGPCLSSTVSCC